VTGALKLVPLRKNCTVPVEDVGDTLAVNVTGWPEITEVAFELKVVLEDNT